MDFTSPPSLGTPSRIAPGSGGSPSGAPASVTAVRFGGVATPSRQLVFRCDPANHCVVVANENGAVLFAFGSLGDRPGEFNTPIDVALVAPVFEGEPVDAIDPFDEPIVWLAVADYGNRRVQIFELDGAYVGSVDDIEHAAAARPCRLAWRAPMLEVETVDGRRGQVHLAAALLRSAAERAC